MSRRPLTLVLAGVTFVLGLPTLVRLVGDHGRPLLVVTDVTVPLLVVPLGVLLVLQLVLRRRAIAAATAALLLLDALWLVPLYVADAVRVGAPLTVLTANLRFGEADPDALVRLVRTHQVDVLATQELTPEAVARLHAAGLDAALPYSDLRPFRDADGCGLWSRYPIDVLPDFTLRFQSPGAVIQLPTRQVVVRVVHPFPPFPFGDGARYRKDNAALRAQVRRLDPTTPTVVAGDLNASADNSELRALLDGRFRDASEQAGSGLQLTWSPKGWPALLQLDHVLVDAHIEVRSTQVLDLPGSDHRALLARLDVG